MEGRFMSPTAVPMAISAPSPLAAAAGTSLARSGGNAVDAAIAAAMVAATTEPGLASLGGAAYVTISPPDGTRSVTIDGGVAVPGLEAGRASQAEPDLRAIKLTYGGRMLDGHFGWASVATPGCIAALCEAHSLQGSSSWADVVAPAIEIAASGFPLGASAAAYLAESASRVFASDPEIASVVLDAQGHAVQEGATLRIPYLPGFLARLAREGPGAFYAGTTAAGLASAMALSGGRVTLQDLRSYRPASRDSLRGSFHSWTLFTNPKPAAGGIRLLSVLRHIAGAMDSRSEDAAYRAAIEAMARNLATPAPTASQADGQIHESPSTVHVSTVDSSGLACAVTLSSGYGAGVTVPQTGIWLANSLGELELNRPGMYQQLAGVRIPSNMAPSVARSQAGDVFAIGTPGAERITSALSLVLAAVFFREYPVREAIRLPRVHVALPESADPRLVLEFEANLPDLARPRPGDFACRTHPPYSMYFGGVNAAVLHPDGSLEAIADPRRNGSQMLVP